MHKVIYTEKVKIDLIEIQDYISKDNLFYGFKVINSISNTIDLLETFPRLWIKMDDNNYSIVEKNYWYKIVYKIIKNNIYILWIFKFKNNWQ